VAVIPDFKRPGILKTGSRPGIENAFNQLLSLNLGVGRRAARLAMESQQTDGKDYQPNWQKTRVRGVFNGRKICHEFPDIRLDDLFRLQCQLQHF
jgi:hypothetical protein